MDIGAWQVTVHGVIRVGHDLVTKPPQHTVLDAVYTKETSKMQFLSLKS